MASFKKTYDTDSIVLRRIFAVNPDTNGRISANTFLVTGDNGTGSFQDALSFLSTLNVPTSLIAGSGISLSNINGSTVIATDGSSIISISDLTSTTKGLGLLGYVSTIELASTIANLGQIYNSTILVAGTNITFSSNANQITINGQAGGGAGDILASDLTSTTKGLGLLGYVSTIELASTIANLGQIYNSTILVAGTNITFSSNANQITINGQAGGGAGDILASDLTSTTKGLGLLGYLSSFNTISSLNISSGSHFTNFLSSQEIMASSITANKFIGDGSLIINVPNLGVTQINAGTGININQTTGSVTITATGATAGTVVDINLTSTIFGLSDFGYISTSALTSTTKGLGLLGYVSTIQLASTIANLGQVYNSTILVAGTNITFSSNANQITINGQAGGGAGDVTALNLTSTTKGLGSLGYISSILGFKSGTVYYLNWSQAGPTFSYKSLQATITNGSQQSDVIPISANSDQVIQRFQTSTTLPSFISAGIWDLNLFVKSDSYYIRIYYKLYKLNGSTSTQIAINSLLLEILPSDGNTIAQVTLSIAVPYTSLSAGDTLYIEIHGVNLDISSPHNLTVYYEANTYSHIHTTFLESATELSTINGLGSLGYLSSFNTISSLNISSGSLYTSFLSSKQMITSSITATKFIGNGSLLTNIVNSVTAGSGINLTAATGNITVSNSGVLSITQGSGISITGTSGAYTIAATGGVAGTVATADLVSTVIGIQNFETLSLTSSLNALGSMGYLSSAAELISTPQLISSLNALGSMGYLSSAAELISTPQLISSLNALGSMGYLSSAAELISTPQLISSLNALGSMGYLSSAAELISTPQLISSLNALGSMGNLQLTSSIEALGSMSYISSFNTISSLNISSGSLFANTTSTTETNAGRLNFGSLYNNGIKLIDDYGNILFSFQTL